MVADGHCWPLTALAWLLGALAWPLTAIGWPPLALLALLAAGQTSSRLPLASDAALICRLPLMPQPDGLVKVIFPARPDHVRGRPDHASPITPHNHNLVGTTVISSSRRRTCATMLALTSHYTATNAKHPRYAADPVGVWRGDPGGFEVTLRKFTCVRTRLPGTEHAWHTSYLVRMTQSRGRPPVPGAIR
jgi:hypothetical protein